MVYVSLLLVLILAAVVAAAARQHRRGEREQGDGEGDVLVREMSRRLDRNPHDAQALLALADSLFDEKRYPEAQARYQALTELCATHPELDEFTITLREGICLLESGRSEDAAKSLLIARAMKPEDFQANHHLGVIELGRKSPEKAAAYLQAAHGARPDHVETAALLGKALHAIRRPAEAVAPLVAAVAADPGNAEAAFLLARCRLETGQVDEALASFTRLRLDPQWGARAALYAGTINLKRGEHAKAAEDFEVGLRHRALAAPILHELQYRLASAWLRDHQIARAVELLSRIAEAQPDFRDVKELLDRYSEVAADNLLRTYTLAPAGEFAALCRRLTAAVHSTGRVKVIEVSARRNEWVDVVAQVTTPRWDDLVLYRFLRGAGVVGELFVREMYARMREMRSGRGVCCSAGDFSDGARQFVEARLIDLVDRRQLIELFARLRSRSVRSRTKG